MKESDLNTLIVNSFLKEGFGYKIPDPQKQVVYMSSPRPFDGIGLLENKVYFFESKLLKGYQSFNKKRILEHQFNSLNRIKNICNTKNIFNIILIGVYELRKPVDLFIFDIGFFNKLEKSIYKKDLLLYKENKKCLSLLEDKIFNFKDLDRLIIYD